ncbi:CAIB/BAIF family enzyme [Clohesyomyces aquaticus]|uniref:CAIB/BAIF family enzyme n=1 Tax=Clohesyomyces aquaticus TaxID=1231657 RepID=A0A1Y1XY34_9PLEO|nr:CAIB/BAIF family enzyme [Clohesyomyces aquaticus]
MNSRKANENKTQAVLGDLARVLRSKNAGPYELTFDVMFETERVYRMVKEADLLNQSVVAQLFDLPENDIIWSGFFDQALAFKATIPRMRYGKSEPSGGFMESDVHGSQNYTGLLNLRLPQAFVQRLAESQL